MAELFDILNFKHTVVENQVITTTEPDWTDLLTHSFNAPEDGVYKLTFALQFTLNSTSQSFLYRFSLDGGNTWGVVYSKEVKDRSNTEVIEVVNVEEITAGNKEIKLQVTREGSADCSVIKAFISSERKA